MKLADKLFRAPLLTRGRIIFSLAVAVVSDGLQFFLGPLGWVFVDQVIDVIAMVLTTLTIGFHPLLLPTFVVEFFPVVGGMLPTWIGCVIAVIALRKRGQRAPSAPHPPVVDASLPPKPPPQIGAGSSHEGTL